MEPIFTLQYGEYAVADYLKKHFKAPRKPTGDCFGKAFAFLGTSEGRYQ